MKRPSSSFLVVRWWWDAPGTTTSTDLELKASISFPYATIFAYMYICFVLGLLDRRRVKNEFSSRNPSSITYAFFGLTFTKKYFRFTMLSLLESTNPILKLANQPKGLPAAKLELGLWISQAQLEYLIVSLSTLLTLFDAGVDCVDAQ